MKTAKIISREDANKLRISSWPVQISFKENLTMRRIAAKLVPQNC
jgi:hypothetical protein